ncbi:Golgi transport complex subunit 4, variant 2 [Naganishia albida]|nr:Golgi transport complex subunit 4, variant 2 [Naganishia albida]
MSRTLTHPSALSAHSDSLSTRTNQLSLALSQSITARAPLDDALGRLRALVPEVARLRALVDGDGEAQGQGETVNDAWGYDDAHEEEEEDQALRLRRGARRAGLVGRVSAVYETSESVGGKVRVLDARVGRVRHAVETVGDVIEFKTALQTIRDAIPARDWETATRACKRAMDIPEAITNGSFAARVIPTPMDPAPPAAQLAELRQTLLDTFAHAFREAAEQRDEQGTSRFFRLFPMIGAEQAGLAVYADFVVTLVKTRGGAVTGAAGAAASPLYYITNLTTLLESIALIIDQHQPVVEKYYGEGKMRVVVVRLQAEGDKGVKSLVEGWEEERRVGRLISETRQSQFTYLANPIQYLSTQHAQQSNTGATSNAAGNVTSSLAALSSAHLPSAATSLLATYAGSSAQKRTQEDEPASTSALPAEQQGPGPDPRDVERVLGECTALSSRWALYRRFVWDRLVPEDDQEDAERNEESPVQQVSAESANAKRQAAARQTTDVLDESDSRRIMENLLRRYYEPLEAWYLRSSIEKAHKMDTPDLSAQPHISSTVDDTFYLLKLVLNRLVSTGNLSILTSMRERISTIIERDYLGVLQKKMDAVYSGSGVVSGFGAGALAGLTNQGRELERERRERDLRTSFAVLLNDLDVSAQYMDRLIDDLIGSESANQTFLETELLEVEEQMRDLGDLAGRMRTAAKNGLDQLFNQLTRPGLRSLLEDVYKGISYMLDDDGYAEAEEEDLVRKRFVANWAPLVDGYKDTLTEANYQSFFDMTVETLVRPWEKMVQGMRFTELGAIRFDKDVRAVVNHLSGQTNFGGARSKFIRLQQIATILNLDSDEDAEEFYSSSGIAWRLSKTEYDNIVGLRV